MNNRSDETLLLGSVEEIVVRVGKPKRRSSKSQKAAPNETLSVDSQLHEFVAQAITPKKPRRLVAESKRRSGNQRKKVRSAKDS